jgi:hypothetical protein
MEQAHTVTQAAPMALVGVEAQVAMAAAGGGGGTGSAPAAAISGPNRDPPPATPQPGHTSVSVQAPTTSSVPTGREWFTGEQLQRVSEFLGNRGRSKSSAKRYKSGWGYWGKYIEQLPEERRPDLYLEQMASDADKATFLAVFVQHLNDPPHNLRGKSLTAMLTHVKSYFSARTPLSTAFFESATTKTARKSAGRRGSELREKRASMATARKAPLCLSMVEVARQLYWETAVQSTRKGRDAMAKYLGLAIMADTGARSSNITGPVMDSGPNRGQVLYDHGAKCSDVEVEVERLEDGAEGMVVMTAGPALQSYLSRPEVMANGYAKVHSLTIVFLTSKTTTEDTVSLPTRAETARTTDLETRQLQDLCDWFRLNVGQQVDDYILARYSPEPGGQRRLTAQGPT